MAEIDRDGTTTVARGRCAEAIAALYLEIGGYRVLARNARSGPLEVDLIVARGDTVVFVEVRARSSRTHGSPEESVRRRKQERVTRAAERLLEASGLPPGARVRFDLIAIDLEPFGLCLRHRLGYWHPR
jgi:putative endonuclease